MREIKVRGYCVDKMVGSQWVEGFGIMFSEFSEEYAKEKGRKGDYILFTEHGRYEVEGDSIGQYTGLKDKNGREIYEDSIISYCDCNTWRTGGYVADQIRTGVVRFDGGSWIVESGDYSDYLYQIIANDEETEVIGNIYENKELLEKDGVTNGNFR